MPRKYLFTCFAILFLLIQGACAPQPDPISIGMAHTAAQQTIEAILTERNVSNATGTPIATETPTQLQTPTVTATQLPTNSTATLTRSSLIGSCYKILSVTDVTIPDRTQITPGASFIKTWNISNGGTCEWPPDTKVVFVSGEIMGGGSTKTLGAAVPAGEHIDITMTLTAPVTPNKYRGNWMLELSNGTRFGLGNSGLGVFWVEIVVSGTITPSASLTLTTSGTAATQSPTNTPTPTGSITSTPTRSLTPTTATSTPTQTSTASPTPTETLTMTPVTPSG